MTDKAEMNRKDYTMPEIEPLSNGLNFVRYCPASFVKRLFYLSAIVGSKTSVRNSYARQSYFQMYIVVHTYRSFVNKSFNWDTNTSIFLINFLVSP